MHLLAISAFAALIAGSAAEAATGTIESWTAALSSRAEREMVGPRQVSGLVIVEFRRDPRSGRPVGVRVVSRAAEPLRVAALRTIDRLGVLPPLPRGARRDMPITLTLLFARPDTVLMARRSAPAEAASEGAASAPGTQFAALTGSHDASAQRDPC